MLSSQLTPSIRTLTTRRRKLGVSVAAAAALIGVHRSTLLRWEQGTRIMPPDTRRQLWGALDAEVVACDQLLTLVRRSDEATTAEWEGRLDDAGRRRLRSLLAGARLVTASGVRVDPLGRRYVRRVVHMATSEAARGLDRSAPAAATGVQLRAARRFVAISAAELASRVGVAPSTVRDAETLQGVPRARVQQFAEALGLADALTPHRVRTVRRSAGWSLKDLAGRVEFHLAVVQGWEVGRRPVPPGRMLALAAALHEASTVAPKAVDARRNQVLDALVTDVGLHPGATRRAVLHRHQATLGRTGPRIDVARVLAQAVRRGVLVEAAVTTTGPRGGRRTMTGLFVPSAAPAAPAGPRMTGHQLADTRFDDTGARRYTQRQIAQAIGASLATVQQMEARGDQPVPLHWEAPIRDALAKLAGAPSVDVQAREALLARVADRPGISQWVLVRTVSQLDLAGVSDRENAIRRQLQALQQVGDLVVSDTADSMGRRQRGLYLPRDAKNLPAAPTGAQLRSMRTALGWTAERLGTAAGIRPARITRWERTDARLPPYAIATVRAALAGPPPATVGRQLRRLLDLASQPGGTATGDLPTSFFTPGGRATIQRALDGDLIHVEERLAARRNGRQYVRRHLVVGPAPAVPATIERMTGDELRRLRGRAGLTQTALAKIVGSRNTTVWSWESGHMPIPPGRVEQLRSALGAC